MMHKKFLGCKREGVSMVSAGVVRAWDSGGMGRVGSRAKGREE